MPTEEQIDQAETLLMALSRIEAICLREIMAGKGRDYSIPMIRAAVDELEQQFIASPEFRGAYSKSEKN